MLWKFEMAPIDIVDLVVKTISTEMIKPSTPTPSHLKSYKLSLVDQIHPPYHTIMLLFYPKTVEDTPPNGPNLDILKSSLSETLSKYYPFAGRCMDDFTVSCNDLGIPFIETRVIDCVLSDFLVSPNKVNNLHKLTPPKEYRYESELQKRVPLAFQVNIFSCGGVVIGCYKLHKLLLDGTSLVGFLKYWASIATNSGRNRVAPDFDAVVGAFPHCPTLGWRPFDDNCPVQQARVQSYQDARLVAKSFVFNKQAIAELRAMAASEEVPKPTRVETLAGFVWEHCMEAARLHRNDHFNQRPVKQSNRCVTVNNSEDYSTMSLVVNMRPRMNPPVAKTAVGNFVTSAPARAKDNGMASLRDLVREIHVAVSSNISDRIGNYQGGRNIEALAADVDPVVCYKPGTYGLSSWCQFGLDEVDFGFGKPKWASPTNGILASVSRNFMYLVVDGKGDGIEAWLYLEEKEMQLLECNKKFLRFACPN